jgi:hypothetical protein
MSNAILATVTVAEASAILADQRSRYGSAYEANESAGLAHLADLCYAKSTAYCWAENVLRDTVANCPGATDDMVRALVLDAFTAKLSTLYRLYDSTPHAAATIASFEAAKAIVGEVGHRSVDPTILETFRADYAAGAAAPAPQGVTSAEPQPHTIRTLGPDSTRADYIMRSVDVLAAPGVEGSIVRQAIAKLLYDYTASHPGDEKKAILSVFKTIRSAMKEVSDELKAIDA